MLAADYIVDIGPGAGSHGGEVIACGTAEEIMQIRSPLRDNTSVVKKEFLCRRPGELLPAGSKYWEHRKIT